MSRETPRRAEHAVRVMIVDDDREVVRSLRLSLELDGYRDFVCVSDPLAAADIARQEKPGVILLDASMPGVGGIDVLRALQCDGATASIPVVFLCTVNDSQPRRKAQELGVREFLGKPLDPLETVARVRSALLIATLERAGTERPATRAA